MEIAIGATLVYTAFWLKYRPTRAQIWYVLAAICLSNGDAAAERKRQRSVYMAEARERGAA